MIQLDTSFLIRALVPESPEDTLLRTWLASGEVLAMSTIAWAEFLCGPIDEATTRTAGELIALQIPFGEDEAATAARLFNAAGRRRNSLIDCMIAATAIQARARLATANPRDFERFEGLEIAPA